MIYVPTFPWEHLCRSYMPEGFYQLSQQPGEPGLFLSTQKTAPGWTYQRQGRAHNAKAMSGS